MLFAASSAVEKMQSEGDIVLVIIDGVARGEREISETVMTARITPFTKVHKQMKRKFRNIVDVPGCRKDGKEECRNCRKWDVG